MQVTFVRVFSGELSAKGTLYNSTRHLLERPTQVLEIRADELQLMEGAGAGSTVALVGMKHTATGDTLVTPKGPFERATLSGMSIPPPVFALAIEPETSAKQVRVD
jgi:elongation factor G